ncbi:hypothetical protein ACHAPM_008862 [Fusarium culmorum]|uniref:Extracellular membrane protein CFEM domain-containing protein n=1 Tax=Fusarium culmorum TaxID=5516 RepID=A0A2T4GT77_FUSCU|nr:hypothetical protein FCULG_00005324 [Fusarium culmorum]
MRPSIVFATIASQCLLVAARENNDAQHWEASAFDAHINAKDPHQDPWQKGPLVERWRQWMRRQDTSATDDKETSTEAKSETRETTKDEETTTEDKAATTEDKQTTTEDKPTTTEDKPTTTDEPVSTTEESTTEATSTEQSSSSSTISSTETSSDLTSTSTSTRSTLTSLAQGASCYSTTVSTSVVCHITTDGRTESASCITNRMTSSTCAPGLFCEIHPDSGSTVCMEQHNEIGTEGIVVASIFAVCIAGCMAALVGMCVRDKRAQKKFEKLKRVKTLRTAKREEHANLMAAGGQI